MNVSKKDHNIKIINGKVCCPFCEENGYIIKAQINQDKHFVYICDECEGLWIDEKLNENEEILNLDMYITKNGYNIEDVHITYKDYYWHKK